MLDRLRVEPGVKFVDHHEARLAGLRTLRPTPDDAVLNTAIALRRHR